MRVSLTWKDKRKMIIISVTQRQAKCVLLKLYLHAN